MISPTGIRIENNGFEKYRIDVIKQLNINAEKALEASRIIAQKRKEERLSRLSKHHSINKLETGIKSINLEVCNNDIINIMNNSNNNSVKDLFNKKKEKKKSLK